MDACFTERVVRIASDRLEALWVLRDEPSVVLQPQAPLLHCPHPLDGPRRAEAREVIELKRLGLFELVEEDRPCGV